MLRMAKAMTTINPNVKRIHSTQAKPSKALSWLQYGRWYLRVLQLCPPPRAAVIAAAPDVQNTQERAKKAKWEPTEVRMEPEEL